MEIFDLLKKSALDFPERTAAIYQGNSVIFQELFAASRDIAAYLKKLDLSQGARVALLYENSIEYIYLYFAIFGAGLVAVPLDTSLRPEKLKFILDDCEAEVLIIQSKFAGHLQQLSARSGSIKYILSNEEIEIENKRLVLKKLSGLLSSGIGRSVKSLVTDKSGEGPSNLPDNLAAIFYTSGSTGTPKGVMLSHRNLVSNTLATIEYLKLKSNDSVLVILPFYYIYGNSLLLTHIAAGGAVVIDNRFMYPEVILNTMEKEMVTGFSGVPSNFMILLNKSSFPTRRLEHLRYFTQAGGAMAPEIIRKLIAAFPSKEIYIMYGQTEASPRVTYVPPDRLREKIGSIGIPIPGVKVQIMNEDGVEVPDGVSGELTVTGDNVMLGYWKNNDEEGRVIKDNRLYTGDLARKDSDGYIYIIGRKKEIIKTGGNRVSAKEVEERILEHQNVAEVAVFGVYDDILGEAIRAVIVPKEGHHITLDEIKQFCQLKLADFKIPKIIDFMDSLPKYQSGKVDKMQLAKK